MLENAPSGRSLKSQREGRIKLWFRLFIQRHLMTTFREKKIIYIAYCLSKAQKLRKLKIYPFFIFSNNNNKKK